MLHFLWLSVCGLIALYCLFAVWHFTRLADVATNARNYATSHGDRSTALAAQRLLAHSEWWRVVHIAVAIFASVQIFA